jgi:ferric-dicitrate binding protein FerR (iron transport regulator)
MKPSIKVLVVEITVPFVVRCLSCMKHTRIKKEAARRLIELETTADRDACRVNLERWFDEDPQHRAAFEKMERAWKAVDDLKLFHIRGGEHSDSAH